MAVEDAASGEPAARTGTLRWAWRSLIGLWVVVLLIGGATAGVLQYLGPPSHQAAPEIASIANVEASAAVPVLAAVAAEPVVTARATSTPVAHEAGPPETVPHEGAVAHAAVDVRSHPAGAIRQPDSALLEASTLYEGGQLPRIGADRRMPLQAYAAGFDSAETRPRIGILLAGIGMSEAETAAAIAGLPPAVSFAVSPYAARTESFLDAARDAGHELLVSIPMEPQGYPLNDPGTRALLTGASQATNAQRLEWALTRFAGYVGATGALGTMRGERFAAASDQMAPLLDTLARRGLMYVDPRPNALRLPLGAPHGAFRGVDLVLDEPSGTAQIDRSLARLEQIARDRGVALGLAGRPSPVVVDRIAVWALGLSARGVSLAPVSVVVQMPQLPPPPAVRINFPK